MKSRPQSAAGLSSELAQSEAQSGAAPGKELFTGRRFSRWLDRRIPPSPQITLTQRNVFIFPTKTGFAFGGLIVLTQGSAVAPFIYTLF